jgi:hypothetical protein
MSVTLSGSLISFPPMSVIDFTPIHNAINGLAYNIEEVTGIIDGEVKVAGLLIEDAPIDFMERVRNVVNRLLMP